MSALPQPWKLFSDRIYKIEENQRRLFNRSPFTGTGMHTNGLNGMDSDNYVPDVSGWRLAETPEFNNLKLRGGIVGNAALTNPVIPAQQFIGTNTFGLTTSGAYILSRSAPVPAGCAAVTVTAYGRVSAINSTASDDAVYSTIDVNGAGGNQFGTDVRAGKFSTSSVGFSTTLTGLTAGDSVVTRLFASTGLATWASNAANGADLSVTYLWTR